MTEQAAAKKRAPRKVSPKKPTAKPKAPPVKKPSEVSASRVELVQALLKDPDTSTGDLAKKMGVSEATARTMHYHTASTLEALSKLGLLKKD
jgi:hypothetical protein